MTRKEQIKEYNKANPSYNVTAIAKRSKEDLDYMRLHYAKSLDELYQSYSNTKASSYRDILNTYEPIEIIGLQGSNTNYSVTLVASNGDTLWITKGNNYLVKEF